MATAKSQMAPPAPNGGGFAAGDLSESGLGQLPIFNVEPVQLAFSIAADFVAAQVANNVLILALSTGRILRIDLERPEDIDGAPNVFVTMIHTIPPAVEVTNQKDRATLTDL